jgi:hypothetical protein
MRGLRDVSREIERRRELLAQKLALRNSREARKAGGVYYTPAYIVDYIVKNTVGKLLTGRTPGRAAGSLRILDPACGSGAFLLGAYQFLLDWHRACRRRSLTFQERKRILLRHIHGVDIDPQAVETTKLSLLLKLLEGATVRTSAALPGLDRNIRCGNALIGPDFPERRPGTTVNVFDWPAAFPEVFSAHSPGFDVVLGNPPYLSYSGRHAARIAPAERAYFVRRYRTAGWPTAHGLFIELAATLLSRRSLAFIVPDQVGHLAGYGDVRRVLLERHRLCEVRYWGEGVFGGAVTPALTFIADTGHAGMTIICDAGGRSATVSCRASDPWVVGRAPSLLAKVRQNAISLGKLVADPGVHTGNCAAKLIIPLRNGAPRQVPILEGKQVARYRCDVPGKALRLDYRPKAGEYFTIRAKERYTAARFVIRQTAGFPIVGPREHADYFRNSLLALYAPTNGMDVRYLVGLLNSRLLRYVYTQTVRESRQKAFPQVKVRALRALPVRRIDFRNASDVALHAEIVAFVQQMLARPTDAGDRRIDQLVYRLYGLTDKEITNVQQALSAPPCSPADPRRATACRSRDRSWPATRRCCPTAGRRGPGSRRVASRGRG